MIGVIGAGPVGSYTSYLLSRNGFKVNLYDEKKKIGKPVQCTGLLTKDISKFLKLSDDFVLNKIKSIRLQSNNKEVLIPTKEYVVDRTKFDQYVLDMSSNNGAKFYSKYKYITNDKNKIKFQNDTILYDRLVGADGPQSRVASNNGLYGNRKFLLGIQSRVKMDTNSDEYTVFFDNKKYPGFFGWIVPESESVARVGVAGVNPKQAYQYLLKKIGHSRIIENQGGLIPIFNRSQKIQNNNVYLVGDAALQVKATTGGGIIPGFKSAKNLVRSIKNGKDYSVLNKSVSSSLSLHKRIRDTLDRFSNDDYDYLLLLFMSKRVQNTLKQTSRDNMRKLAFNLLIKEPRFLIFMRKLIK